MKIHFPAVLAAGLLFCPPTVFAAPAGTDAAPGARLKEIVEGYFDRTLELEPLFATRLGEHRYDAELGSPGSLQTRARHVVLDRQALNAAQAVPRDALTPADQLTLDLFIRDLTLELDGERFPDYLMPINQLDGLPTMLAVFGSGSGPQPFNTLAEHQAWLHRAGEFPAWVDGAIAAMREGMVRGVTLPRATASRIAPQLDQILAAKTEDSVFWLPVREHMPADIDDQQKTELAAAYRALIETRLVPAYRKLRDFIANEYAPHCRASSGWEALPDGAAWYAYAIRSQRRSISAPTASMRSASPRSPASKAKCGA